MLALSVASLLAWLAPSPSALGARVHRPSVHHAVVRASAGAAATGTGPVVPFEDWAEANGINAPKLAVTGKEDLRGVVVLEDVEEDEELCCVPRTSCLDLAAVEGVGSPCEELVPTSLWAQLRWYERLACWLLAERRRGAASPVVGYIGYLPRPEAFSNAPLEWTDDELKELSCDASASNAVPTLP
jgi:hypothetical protein